MNGFFIAYIALGATFALTAYVGSALTRRKHDALWDRLSRKAQGRILWVAWLISMGCLVGLVVTTIVHHLVF